MKKLLFISPGFPADETQTYVLPFIQQFIKAFALQYPDIKITIVALHKPVAQPYHWHGMRVIPLNGNDVGYPRKIMFLFRAFIKLWQLQRQEQFDGILSFWNHALSALTRIVNTRSFIWLQGQDAKLRSLIFRFWQPEKSIIAISDFNKKVLFDTMGIAAQKIIPIAVNADAFPPLNTSARNIDIFGAGTLSPLKNYGLFIEAVGMIKAEYPQIKAAIAGSGPEEIRLKNLVTENGLTQNVIFLGQLSHAETLAQMNQSKIFLHTSVFEGGATVYHEALYSGCQVVGTLDLYAGRLENFHLARTAREIADTIIMLLQEQHIPERIVYRSMELVCRDVYALFFESNAATREISRAIASKES